MTDSRRQVNRQYLLFFSFLRDSRFPFPVLTTTSMRAQQQRVTLGALIRGFCAIDGEHHTPNLVWDSFWSAILLLSQRRSWGLVLCTMGNPESGGKERFWCFFFFFFEAYCCSPGSLHFKGCVFILLSVTYMANKRNLLQY